MPKAVQCFGVYDSNNIIGFLSVIHQPNSKNKKIKRVCRLVILPDYQGIGIGCKFLETIADYYKKKNFDFSIITSAKNLIYALYNNKNWRLIRYSQLKNKATTKKMLSIHKQSRVNCKTASFFYKRS